MSQIKYRHVNNHTVFPCTVGNKVKILSVCHCWTYWWHVFNNFLDLVSSFSKPLRREKIKIMKSVNSEGVFEMHKGIEFSVISLTVTDALSYWNSNKIINCHLIKKKSENVEYNSCYYIGSLHRWMGFYFKNHRIA